jgi:hypothetical protein
LIGELMVSRALAALGLNCWLIAACGGDDGYTPTCPELPLFDVKNPSERNAAAVVRLRAEAVLAGCLGATGEPVLDGSAGSAGSAAEPDSTAGSGGAP